jgi:hypothetical protein
MTNPFPFASGDVLTAAELNAIGEWSDFTPTFYNVTLGASGTVVGKYAEVNNLVFYNAAFFLNGTGSVTGTVQMAVPNGLSAYGGTTYATSHNGWVRPTGATIYHCMGFTGASSSGDRVFWYNYVTSGTYSNASSVTGSLPATWDSNGIGYFAGWYAKQ